MRRRIEFEMEDIQEALTLYLQHKRVDGTWHVYNNGVGYWCAAITIPPNPSGEGAPVAISRHELDNASEVIQVAFARDDYREVLAERVARQLQHLACSTATVDVVLRTLALTHWPSLDCVRKAQQ